MPQPSAASRSIDRVDLDFAATSTPRVGSSRRKIAGPAISHLAMTTFCWLPPERLLAGCRSIGPDLMLQRLGDLGAGGEAARRRSTPSGVAAKRGSAASAMFSAIGTFIISPSSRRFSVMKAMRAAMARRGVIAATGAAADDELAAVEAVEAEQDAGELGAAGAHQPEEPDDLARGEAEGRCRSTRPAAVSARASSSTSARTARVRGGIELVDVAPEHQVDHARDRELRLRAGARPAGRRAAPRCRRRGRARRRGCGRCRRRSCRRRVSLADQLEQARGLARRQRGGRLVEDDDAGVELQRLGDLDQLPLARREPLDQRIGRQVEIDLAEQRRGPLGAGPLRSISPPRRRGKPAMKRFSAMSRLVKRLSS